jgi:ComF family protein
MLSLWRSWSSRWPGLCQVCGSWPSQPVCPVCLARFAQPRWRCQACARLAPDGQALCGACLPQDTRAHLDRCVAAVDYAYPWDALIGRLKFQSEPAWAHTMSEVLASRPQVRVLLAEADWIVPIPLAPTRLAERGYNQAWEIVKALRARGLAQGWDFPQPMAQALVRRDTGQDQHTLRRVQRWQNLRHAFEAHPVHGQRLAGQRVLLVDDVCTTGATLQMAARTLKRAGARQVDGLVFARTEPPHEP